MDPNLFHLDWERTFEALTLVIVLAFLIERALAVLFESPFFVKHMDRPGVKELLAVGVSIAICFMWKLDVVSMIVLTEKSTLPGFIVSGAVIAGGSKASIKLFHDVMNVKSASYDRRHEIAAEQASEEATKAAAEATADTAAPKLNELATKARKAYERAKNAACASGTPQTREAAEKAKGALETIETQVTKKTKGGDRGAGRHGKDE